MNTPDDIFYMLWLAKSRSLGRDRRYRPGLELAYERTINYLAEHWEPKREKPPIILTISHKG